MQAPLASRKSYFFGTSWEQRWWPRQDRNSGRLAVSSLARDCRLYVARHEVMFAGSYNSNIRRAGDDSLSPTRPRRPKLPSLLLGFGDEGVDARPGFSNVCLLHLALLPLCPPRAEQDHGSPFEPTTTALSLRRSPLAAPQRSATQRNAAQGPVSSGR
ncbi:hypothetical protein TGAM01_v201225 [Trichoderma gamsii]|uniref:Uncharacterized protein n=1 Tax=Trichoderma gamsii TaxID=398673 RepID=A0A2P4ZZY1_9HYPO|nr:hypothetical protein TGAM01_v201225 [Trichoderma gamsii]PON29859.1 hypothetical protein TGAM01_v201225 [Trichoderma gamsii]